MVDKVKSFQKIVQINPDVAIVITGNGKLEPNLEQAEKYCKYLNSIIYNIIKAKEISKI